MDIYTPDILTAHAFMNDRQLTQNTDSATPSGVTERSHHETLLDIQLSKLLQDNLLFNTVDIPG